MCSSLTLLLDHLQQPKLLSDFLHLAEAQGCWLENRIYRWHTRHLELRLSGSFHCCLHTRILIAFIFAAAASTTSTAVATATAIAATAIAATAITATAITASAVAAVAAVAVSAVAAAAATHL